MISKFFCLLILFITTINVQIIAQEKTKDYVSHKPEIGNQPIHLPIKNIDSIILNIKQDLKKDYEHSDRYNKEKNKEDDGKHILNVGWYDSNLNKITSSSRGELISIIVLVSGYEIGDTVRVTIGDEEKESSSLLADEDCNSITFIGIVNYDNMAFLENIFTVKGAEEHLVISEKWKNRYMCK